MKRRIIICAFLLIVACVQANIYRTYDVRSGMSGNCVRSIVQDSIGFMWFATQDGLNRFDGIEFTHYEKPSKNENEANLNIITLCLHSDNHHIWVASTEKLYLFDMLNETFSAFELPADDGKMVNSVFGMTYDNNGQLWIGTVNGLFVYNEQKSTLKHYLHSSTQPHTLPYNHVWTVYNDSFGTIWIGTKNGLAKYNARTDNFTTFRSEGTSFGHPICNEILSLMESSQGKLWVGTWNGGLAQFNKETGSFNYHFGEGDTLSIPRIRTLFQKSVNSFYIGSDDGLYTFDTNTSTCSLTDNEQIRKSIYSCYRDREGGIWIGSYFNGVSYLSPKHSDIEWYVSNGTKNGLSGNVISQFCEAPNGNIWIATEDGGLNLFNPKNGTFKSHFTPNFGYRNIHALLCDKDNIWIGSFSKGLYIWNTKTGNVKNYRYEKNNPQSIPNDHIYSILKTRDGTIYLGTLTGFCQYHPENDSFETIKELSHTFIYDMAEDRFGNLWLASKRDGIWRYEQKTHKLHNYRHSVNDNHSPCSNWVVRVYIDHKENLWFCTEGSGFCRYDYNTNSFINYTTRENLPNGIIYGILDDQSGNYWLSSNKGLIRYEPQTLKAQLYTIDDGLQSNQFNFRSSMEAHDGKFYFGGVNGFNCFYPFKLSVNKVKPTTSISAVYLHSADEQISQSKRIPVLSGEVTIPANAASFDVMFESLSYVAPTKNRYAYRLDGVHEKWIYTDKHYVSFLNLPPGKYTFWVKSSNNDGYWSEKGCCLSIEVLPPWWKTVYARLFYILVGCGLIFLLCKRYIRRQQNIKLRKINDLEQSRKQELYQAKINFFTQVVHEIKTPLSLIKAPLEVVLEAKQWNADTQNNLLVIQKNTNRLMELVKQLLDFRKIDKEGYKLSFQPTNISELITDTVERFKGSSTNGLSFNISLPEHELIFNVDKEALTKIISNLLTNAMKYGHTSIAVKAYEKKDDNTRILHIKVADDGPGIPQEEQVKVFEPFYQTEYANKKSGVGIGLSLVKLLVEKHNGKVHVNPAYTAGCEICIEIPQSEAIISSADNLLKETENTTDEETNSAAPYTLLIVEDTKDMREFLVKNLGTAYHIYTASNGNEALSCLEHTAVDLIISDILMPEMNGFELLKAIRSDNMLCHIPFILLSAIDNIDTKIEGLDNGADAYIEKPFSLNHIKATINNLLENRHMLYKRFNSAPNMQYEEISNNKADMKWLETVNEIIINNFTNENFSIEKMAEDMDISRSNLQRKLKGLTGMPPNDYIRLIRLKTAGELLRKGEYRINEVCYIVGFNNPSYFARCFRKQFGILPKEYVHRKEEES